MWGKLEIFNTEYLFLLKKKETGKHAKIQQSV